MIGNKNTSYNNCAPSRYSEVYCQRAWQKNS